jgi:pSer/pThr/pTyr-binding forkhead associated (FHA) protein
MTKTDAGSGWLEDADGHQIPIRGSCSIGRSASNQVGLSSDKVSRRHAIIQVQREREYWLVDFGSRNGTYLNGRRIIQPIRLHDDDHVNIGPFEFIFRLPQSAGAVRTKTIAADTTETDIRHAKCWLLVADIVNSTQLLKELPLDEVPTLTGRWVAECKQTIEEHGGRINQFMGDGFFAYWRDHERGAFVVSNALHALHRLQAQASPAFRVVAHYGEVVIGGFSLGEEERISGEEVHFTFRMEKLAGELKEPRLLSPAAKERLAVAMEIREVGHYRLPGFQSDIAMYAF